MRGAERGVPGRRRRSLGAAAAEAAARPQPGRDHEGHPGLKAAAAQNLAAMHPGAPPPLGCLLDGGERLAVPPPQERLLRALHGREKPPDPGEAGTCPGGTRGIPRRLPGSIRRRESVRAAMNRAPSRAYGRAAGSAPARLRPAGAAASPARPRRGRAGGCGRPRHCPLPRRQGGCLPPSIPPSLPPFLGRGQVQAAGRLPVQGAGAFPRRSGEGSSASRRLRSAGKETPLRLLFGV